MERIRTPVKVTPISKNIIDADGATIAMCGAVGAVEIAQAVNAYDALVAACESVLESMDIATEGFGDSIANGMFKGAFLGVRKQTETALDLAKGGTGG